MRRFAELALEACEHDGFILDRLRGLRRDWERLSRIVLRGLADATLPPTRFASTSSRTSSTSRVRARDGTRRERADDVETMRVFAADLANIGRGRDPQNEELLRR